MKGLTDLVWVATREWDALARGPVMEPVVTAILGGRILRSPRSSGAMRRVVRMRAPYILNDAARSSVERHGPTCIDRAGNVLETLAAHGLGDAQSRDAWDLVSARDDTESLRYFVATLRLNSDVKDQALLSWSDQVLDAWLPLTRQVDTHAVGARHLVESLLSLACGHGLPAPLAHLPDMRSPSDPSWWLTPWDVLSRAAKLASQGDGSQRPEERKVLLAAATSDAQDPKPLATWEFEEGVKVVLYRDAAGSLRAQVRGAVLAAGGPASVLVWTDDTASHEATLEELTPELWEGAVDQAVFCSDLVVVKRGSSLWTRLS